MAKTKEKAPRTEVGRVTVTLYDDGTIGADSSKDLSVVMVVGMMATASTLFVTDLMKKKTDGD